MPGTSGIASLKHYKGEQNIGEVQASQECGSSKPADWLAFFFGGGVQMWFTPTRYLT